MPAAATGSFGNSGKNETGRSMTDRSAAARVPDLFALMGGDDAFLHLVVQKDMVSYADLKGRVLSVDALSTGFLSCSGKFLNLAAS